MDVVLTIGLTVLNSNRLYDYIAKPSNSDTSFAAAHSHFSTHCPNGPLLSRSFTSWIHQVAPSMFASIAALSTCERNPINTVIRFSRIHTFLQYWWQTHVCTSLIGKMPRCLLPPHVNWIVLYGQLSFDPYSAAAVLQSTHLSKQQCCNTSNMPVFLHKVFVYQLI